MLKIPREEPPRPRNRLRWVKWFLRRVPRRATVHRYRYLRPYAEQARRRHYLLSLKREAVQPALLFGMILAMQPLYGAQIPLAIFLAFRLRLNLPVFAGMQLVTNPFTAWPLYLMAYQLGRWLLLQMSVEVPQLSLGRFKGFFGDLFSGQWGENLEFLAQVFGVTSLGGFILGAVAGLLLSQGYGWLMPRRKRPGATPAAPHAAQKPDERHSA